MKSNNEPVRSNPFGKVKPIEEMGIEVCINGGEKPECVMVNGIRCKDYDEALAEIEKYIAGLIKNAKGENR